VAENPTLPVSSITVRCTCGVYIRAVDIDSERAYQIAYQFLQAHAYHEPYPPTPRKVH
jgi:hypothetical protein